MKPLLTIDEAAALLRISKKTIYNGISDGKIKIPYVRVGGIKFKEEDLEEFIKNRTVKPRR
jgi:excisionase family DNA binding protein